MSLLVREAVEPLRDAAVQRARQEARGRIDRIKQHLSECGWDLDQAAPSANGRMSRARYSAAQGKRALYGHVVRTDPSRPPRFMSDPHMVVESAEKEAAFIEDAGKDAGAQYDAFIAKLQSKVGDVISARLQGNHVWSYSVLVVTRPDGSEEYWKTQMIINFSKLGRPFHQWPTRKVKTAR